MASTISSNDKASNKKEAAKSQMLLFSIWELSKTLSQELAVCWLQMLTSLLSRVVLVSRRLDGKDLLCVCLHRVPHSHTTGRAV